MPTYLYLQIADEIEKTIKEQEIPNGTRLASERELAAKYFVSRNVVRNALRELERRNIVELIPNDGAIISRDLTARALQELRELFVHGTTSFLDCIEVREMLETAICNKAVNYIGEREIALLEGKYAEMQIVGDNKNLSEFLRLDRDFHETIAEFIPNRLFFLLLDTFFKISPLDFFSFNRILADQFGYSQRDHYLLIEAFKSHNVQSVTDAVHQSMDNLRERYCNLNIYGN